MGRLLQGVMENRVPMCPRCGAVVDGRIVRYGMAGERRVRFVRECQCGRRVRYSRSIRAIGRPARRKRVGESADGPPPEEN